MSMKTPLQTLQHHVTGAIERGEKVAIVGKPRLKTFRLVWSPEGKTIATVQASCERAAKRKAPQPYRKFLGEIYAEVQP